MSIPPAILFDFDGTLVASENIWFIAHVEALREFGVSSSESELRELVGQNLHSVFSHFLANSGVEQSSEELAKAKAKFFQTVDEAALKLIPDYLKATPGAQEALMRFRDIGSAVAICSNAPTYFVEATLSFLEMTDLVENIFSAANTDKGKPHPFVYQQAIDTLDLDKKQTLAVEDSKSGAAAALAAGIPVALLNQTTDEAEMEVNCFPLKSLHELTPDFVLDILSRKNTF